MTMRAFIISNFLAFCVIANPRKNVLNNSKNSVEPTVFWPILRSRHNITDPQYSVAFLHSVNMVTNPPTSLPYPTDFLKFTGTSDSFAEAPWNVNSFTTSTSMAILLYLYFEEPMQNATLIQFEGNSGGFELMLESGILKARFHSLDGTQFEHSAPEFDLKANEWHFVGAEYNHLWETNDQFDLLYVSDSAFNATALVSTLNNVGNIPDIDISGCLRIGQNFNGDMAFKGYMSCLQFYAVSVYHPKEILKDLFVKCDPNLWTIDWDTTADFIPESSPFCVSDVTTTQQTTPVVPFSASTTENGSTIQQFTTQPVSAVDQSTVLDMSTIRTGTTDKQSTTQSGSTVKQSTTKPESTVEQLSTKQESTVDQLSTKHGSTGHQETTQTRSFTEQPTTLSGSTVEVLTTKPRSTVVQLTTDPLVPGSTVEQHSTRHGSTVQQFSTKTGSSVKQPYTYSESTVEQFTTNPVYIGSTVQQFTKDSGSTVDQLTTKHGSTVHQITTGHRSSVKQPTTLSGSTFERTTANATSTVEKLTSDSGSPVEQFTTQSGVKFGSGSGSTNMQSNISSTAAKPTLWSFESPLERCVQFEKLSSNRAIRVADLGVYTFTTMSECVYQCLTNDMCSAISVEYVGGFVLCSTSTDYSTTVFASGHETYYRLFM